MNQITVNFIECDPVPPNGYNVQWRVAGTVDPYNDAGNFTSSPAVFTDDTNPSGTQYEGFIRSDCSESGESGFNYGNPIDWTTVVESGSGGMIAGIGEVYGLDCGENSTIEDIIFNDDSIPILTGAYPVQPGGQMTLQPGVTGTGVLAVRVRLSPIFRTSSVRVVDSTGEVQCLEWYALGSLHTFVFNNFTINEEKFSVQFSCYGCV